jgi:hypothetical protein
MGNKYRAIWIFKVLTDKCRYNPFLRSDTIGVAIGFSDPVFREYFREKHGKEIEEDMQTAAAEWTSTAFSAMSHSWEDVKFLQDNWHGPIVLKGIQTVEDAKKCVEIGVHQPSTIRIFYTRLIAGVSGPRYRGKQPRRPPSRRRSQLSWNASLDRRRCGRQDRYLF